MQQVGQNARSCPDRNNDRIQRGRNLSSSLQPAKAVAIQTIEGENEFSTVRETDQEPDDYDEERMRMDEEENSLGDAEKMKAIRKPLEEVPLKRISPEYPVK